MTITIIRPDGCVEHDDSIVGPPSLDKLQKMVGGYIERVPWFNLYGNDAAQAWVDEEGKLKYKRLNLAATRLWHDQLPKPTTDQLVGNVVILTGKNRLK